MLITRDGAPLARLVPAVAEEARERVPGTAKGLFTVPADSDAPLDDVGTLCRTIIGQAQGEGGELVSADAMFDPYTVRRLW
ncbi:hypothetical protein [Longimicrobium sp.]|uniref:hypothetical protein n=1 Tax=Longimicrobium sp. TaxID=2029185 RepID=UPI003B3B0B10